MTLLISSLEFVPRAYPITVVYKQEMPNLKKMLVDCKHRENVKKGILAV